MRDRMNVDAAGRVRRSLKAGRPARMLNESIPVLEAVKRLTDDADRARSAMCKEGLDPDDIHLALAYAKPSLGEFGLKWLPALGQIGPFVTAFERIETETQVLFLGILWCQCDRDVDEGKPGHFAWVTQWMAGPLVERQLRALRETVTHPQN
jgi:hypothetical protein